MNFKTTYAMFVVLIALLAIFGIWQAFGTKPGMEAYVMASAHKEKVDSDKIDGVILQRTRPKDEKFVFVRGEDKQWQLTEPFADRVEKFAMEDLVRQVLDARREENTDIDSNLKKWGLDNPAVVVTLQSGADKKWTFNLGNESPGGTSSAVVYVSSGDRPKEPAAVKRSELASLFKNINELRPKTLLADSSFDITSVKLQEPKHDLLAFDKNSEGRWRYEKPPYGDADFDGETVPPSGTSPPNNPITGVRDLLQAVTDIRVESDADFGDTNASDVDLAAKGLAENKPERMQLEVKTQGTLSAEAKKDTGPRVLLIGKKADDKGEKLFARLKDSKNIVKVPAKNVDRISKVIENPAALRNRELTQIDAGKTNSIDAIDIQASGQPLLRLRRAPDTGSAAFGGGGHWKIYEAGKTQDADNAAVQGLVTALTAKRLVKEFPEASKTDADLGLDKPTAVVSLWVDGIKKDDPKDEKKDDQAKDANDQKKDTAKDEKKDARTADKKEDKKDPNAEPKLKDDKPTVKLFFGKRAKDVVYVKREENGDTVRLAVPPSVLEKAEEGKLAYLERKLTSYGLDVEVTRLVLTRGGETFELERTKDDKGALSPWKIKQPKEFIGRTADPYKINSIFGHLRNLQAEKLVAEKATAAVLERFGLASPQQKVVLTLTKSDKKTEDHVYLFGKETEDKSGVYSKQGSSDMIFIVQKPVVEALQGELLDPTILTFDPAKTRGLKLTGWQDIIGSPFTLDLNRKTATDDWNVKSPADFKVDGNKVNAFLTGLTNLRALHFLPPKAPLKPEYRLDVKDGALEAVLVVEGEKEPITLIIGGPSGTDGFYARSNKAPGDVFVLPKGPFEQARSRPAHFKKE